MKKSVVIFGTILLVIAIEMLLLVPVIVFTPADEAVIGYFNPTPTPTPTPILSAKGQTPPTLKSRIAYLIDEDTNMILLDKNGQQRVPMASTTKTMTALIALDKLQPDQLIKVSKNAVDEVTKHQGSTANLVEGEQIPMKELLYGLMLPSGADAAVALAEATSGSQTKFVELMNAEAKKLGLKNTHFINASGLTYLVNDKPDPGQYSTAADLTLLAKYAMQNEMFADVVRVQVHELPANDKHQAHTWDSTNKLIARYAGTTGIKTGFTEEAGYCLIFSAKHKNHNLLGVVLDGKDENDRFDDAASILEWGFNLPLRPPPAPTPTALPTKAAA